MTPTATNDTGIVGDQNTNISEPSFIGQVYVPFPGTLANLSVYVEFSGLHNGLTTLGSRSGRSRFHGQLLTCRSRRTPTVPSRSRRRRLCRKASRTCVAVVVGQVDQPPLPGLAAVEDGRVPHRQDGSADHGCVVHAGRTDPAAAQFAGAQHHRKCRHSRRSR